MRLQLFGLTLFCLLVATLNTFAQPDAVDFVIPEGSVISVPCAGVPDDPRCQPPEPPPVDPCEADPEAAGCPCPDELGFYPYCPRPPADKWVWTPIPNSALADYAVPGYDDNVIYSLAGAHASNEMRQKAESGGTPYIDPKTGRWMLAIHGGGHMDGAHNGVSALDCQDFTWEDVTKASPLYLFNGDENGEDTIAYHDGRREPAGQYGIDCYSGSCNMGPDGQPVAQHTYNLPAWDGGDYIYQVGGSQWVNGKSGLSPAAWRLNLVSDPPRWEIISDTLDGYDKRVVEPNGMMVIIDDTGYLINASGYFNYAPATDIWTRAAKGVAGITAKTDIQYNAEADVFVAIGYGRSAVLPRAEFGQPWTTITAPDYLVYQQEGDPKRHGHHGSIAEGEEIIYWKSGTRIDIYNAVTDTWTTPEVDGDPGAVLVNGTFGRFARCGEYRVLVNGLYRDAYVLTAPGETPPAIDPIEPPIEPPVDPIEPPIEPPVEPPVDPGDMPQVDLLQSPYYGERQPGHFDKVCGPASEFATVTIQTPEQLEAWNNQRRRSGERIRLEIHDAGEPYGTVKLKTNYPSCYAVVGVGDPPLLRGVNATHSAGPTVQKGVYLENLRISQFAYDNRHGTVTGGDCVGMPNDGMAFFMRDIDIDGCYHHTLITSKSTALVVDMVDVTARMSYSHNFYFDGPALVYAENVLSSDPGWGHAFRCIAGTCLIKGGIFSNVALDGTSTKGKTRPDGKPLKDRGMAPLEVYLCGTGHTIEDTVVRFYRDRDWSAASHAIAMRPRDAQWSCSRLSHDDTQWTIAEYGSPEWVGHELRQDRTFVYRGVSIECHTDIDHEKAWACDGFHAGTTHSIANDAYRADYQAWAQEYEFSSIEAMLEALPNANLPYPAEWYAWTASQVLPIRREAFASGRATGKWPVPNHPTVTGELGYINLVGVTLLDGDRLIRATNDADYFCWSVLQPDDSCPNPLMPISRYFIDGVEVHPDALEF